MEQKKVQTIILIVIGALFVTNLVFGRQSMKGMKKVADDLSANVDSLEAVTVRYEVLQQEYTKLYIDLENTRNKVYAFKEKVEKIREGQLNSAGQIKNALDDLIKEYESDTLKVELDTIPNDSLKF